MPRDRIVVRGAREHNLKNITVEIPRDKFVVLTGISGSGKSSLAFDTIYAEGQRKYVESLSAYARQFLGLMEKPDVDHIDGLSPAVSIDQKGAPRNPRSTVGTVTEVYDYLRLLYARAGIPHCPKCGKPISRQTREQIVDQVLARPEGSRIQVLGPIVRGRKGEYRQLFEDLRRQGFARVRVDGIVAELGDEISLDKNKKHWIEVVVDRIVTRSDIQTRLADSVETALKLGQGIMYVEVLPKEGNAGTPTRTRGVARERGNAKRRAVADPTARLLVFSQLFACPDHGSVLPEIEPRIFSFNSPHGACPTCTGLGFRQEFDPDLILDWDKSLSDGAVLPWAASTSTAPSLSDLSQSRIRSGSNSWRKPSPVQVGQAPCGLLNEKMRGSISGSTDPWSGQANSWLKTSSLAVGSATALRFAFPRSRATPRVRVGVPAFPSFGSTSTYMIPCPSFSAVSTESARRV